MKLFLLFICLFLFTCDLPKTEKIDLKHCGWCQTYLISEECPACLNNAYTVHYNIVYPCQPDWGDFFMSEKQLKTLDQHEKEKSIVHTFVESDKPKLNGIACPKCNAELFDSSPYLVLLSMPSKKNIHCSNCNFKGYRTA